MPHQRPLPVVKLYGFFQTPCSYLFTGQFFQRLAEGGQQTPVLRHRRRAGGMGGIYEVEVVRFEVYVPDVGRLLGDITGVGHHHPVQEFVPLLEAQVQGAADEGTDDRRQATVGLAYRLVDIAQQAEGNDVQGGHHLQRRVGAEVADYLFPRRL